MVPEAVATQVRERLVPFVVPDRFAAPLRNSTYIVTSLYLDNRNGALDYETIEGLRSRYKLRVRSYGDDDRGAVYPEVKYRENRVIRKLRCPVPRAGLARVLTGDLSAAGDMAPTKLAALREFCRLQQMRRAVPRVLVRYERQAFVASNDPDVRVTFDRNLAASPEARAIVRAHGRYEPVIPGRVVLELKFTDRSPHWLAAIIRHCELSRRSFSKYSRSVATLASAGLVQSG